MEHTIVNHPEFRVIMVIETSSYLNRLEGNQFSLFAQKFHNSVLKSIKYFKGIVIKSNNNNYLISFDSVSNAVFCALKIQSNFKYITPKFDLPNRKMNIALNAVILNSDDDTTYNEAIIFTTRMCEVVQGDVVVSSKIKTLYESENKNAIINKDFIKVLKPKEEIFLNHLMNYIEKNWKSSDFNMAVFSKNLGYSKSQLYRNLKKISGKSPNNFVREYRLQRALKLLRKQSKNIAEVALESGFNSPAYFSKCFMDKYGILPSKYIQQHID